MQDESQSFVFFETPESLVLFETPPATVSGSTFGKRLKMMIAGVVIAALAAVAFFNVDPLAEPETTRWQRVTEAVEACSQFDPGTAVEVRCRVEAGNTP